MSKETCTQLAMIDPAPASENEANSGGSWEDNYARGMRHASKNRRPRATKASKTMWQLDEETRRIGKAGLERARTILAGLSSPDGQTRRDSNAACDAA